jgi:hypothetical protein
LLKEMQFKKIKYYFYFAGFEWKCFILLEKKKKKAMCKYNSKAEVLFRAK